MSIISAISGGMALLNSINQANAARAQALEAMRQRREAIRFQKDAYNRQLGLYQDARSGGYYNPADREKLIRDEFGLNLKNNLANSNAALYSAGNRAGDSAYDVNNQRISQRSAIDMAKAIQGSKDYAHNAEFRDLASINPSGYTNALMHTADANYQMSQDGYSDPSALIGNMANSDAFDFLKPRRRGAYDGSGGYPSQVTVRRYGTKAA